MKTARSTPPLLAVLLAMGCGASHARVDRGALTTLSVPGAAMRALALDRSRTRPPGHGARFHPPPTGALTAARAPVDQLRCGTPSQRPYAAHIELFAQGHEIVVPAGIGIAPPQHHEGARVDRGRCAYPVRTTDPTGVVLIDPRQAGRAEPTVGDLFKLWGQPLNSHRLASFTVPRNLLVAAFVDGRRIWGEPSAILLRRHAQIVLEAGPHVDPHSHYRFPSGL
jgi:hypothetical protein